MCRTYSLRFFCVSSQDQKGDGLHDLMHRIPLLLSPALAGTCLVHVCGRASAPPSPPLYQQICIQSISDRAGLERYIVPLAFRAVAHDGPRQPTYQVKYMTASGTHRKATRSPFQPFSHVINMGKRSSRAGYGVKSAWRRASSCFVVLAVPRRANPRAPMATPAPPSHDCLTRVQSIADKTNSTSQR